MELNKTLFTNYWHLLCHRRELARDGDYLRFETPIGDVVVFNDADDFVAFDNRCPHRGSAIYEGVQGNKANSCGYHGWAFKNGRVIVPLKELFKDCNIDHIDLNRYRLDWCGDFLFVGVNPQFDLYEQLGDATSTLEEISFNIDRCADLNAYQYDCGWQIAVENALESYHVDMVHSETLGLLKLEVEDIAYSSWTSSWKARITETRIARQLKSLGRYFNVDYQYEGYLTLYLFPFTMISSTYGLSYSVQNFFPDRHRADRTSFISRLLTSNVKEGSAREILAPFFESSKRINHKVFEEDHEVCRMVPIEAWSSAPLKYAAKSEERINHFRGLYRNAMA